VTRGRSWLLALAPALAACSLIYKSDLDDARRPSATTPDAGPDATTPPVGVADAGTDAAAVTGCAAYPTAKFCDDFDTQLNVADGWDKLTLSSEQTKGGFDTLAFSPSRSFKASLSGAGECSYGRLEKTFASAGTSRVTVSFRTRLQAPWVKDAVPFFLRLTGCGIAMGVEINATSNTSIINAQYSDGSNVLQNDVRNVDGSPVPDEWTDVTFDANAQADGHVKLDVIYDHPSGARDDKQVDLPQCRLDGKNVVIGLGYHCSQDTHDVRYDDVRVSWPT